MDLLTIFYKFKQMHMHMGRVNLNLTNFATINLERIEMGALEQPMGIHRTIENKGIL